MGGTGTALDLADTYAWILFSGALVFWIFNTLGSILRGAGIMSLPAMVSVIGAVMTLTVSPTLILGLGPVPRLGIAGAALAILAYYAVGAVILGSFLLFGRAPVKLVLAPSAPWRLYRDVLRVGLPGALNSIVFNSAILLFTALVGPFGTKAIAGYGVGARLEYLRDSDRVRSRHGADHDGRHRCRRRPRRPRQACGLDRGGDCWLHLRRHRVAGGFCTPSVDRHLQSRRRRLRRRQPIPPHRRADLRSLRGRSRALFCCAGCGAAGVDFCTCRWPSDRDQHWRRVRRILAQRQSRFRSMR